MKISCGFYAAVLVFQQRWKLQFLFGWFNFKSEVYCSIFKLSFYLIQFFFSLDRSLITVETWRLRCGINLSKEDR